MTFQSRKVIKTCFTILCTITVAFMMGYWFKKYEFDDRDIGVVDYTPLEEAKDIKFPDVSICIVNPFHAENLKATNSDITVWDYSSYLDGEHYDKMYEEIDFANVTLDLNQYFLFAQVMWQDGTSKSILSDSITYIETFTGFQFLFSGSYFLRCFTMRLNVEEQQRVNKVRVNFDKKRMISDLSADENNLLLVVHYPNQFFLHKSIQVSPVSLDKVVVTGFNMEKIEILKQRNSRHRKCSRDIENYDKNIVDEVLQKTGCRPPYLRSHQSYPRCKTQKDIKEGKIDSLARKRVRIPNACQRISEVREQIQNVEENFTMWGLGIAYPEEVKIIEQSKDVDVHSLIGNIGGYLGLFLGTITVLIE